MIPPVILDIIYSYYYSSIHYMLTKNCHIEMFLCGFLIKRPDNIHSISYILKIL